MLLEPIYFALQITAFLVGVAAVLSFILWLAPLIGRPLVRRLFNLVHSDDPTELAQSGAFARLILGVLIVGIWVWDCARETSDSGLLLTEWSRVVFGRVTAETVLVAVLVLGMLSGLAVVLPAFGEGRRGERRTKVRNVF